MKPSISVKAGNHESIYMPVKAFKGHMFGHNKRKNTDFQDEYTEKRQKFQNDEVNSRSMLTAKSVEIR